ncbi:helix-turn-helix domain-containing protein [Psychrobacillus sp. NPDC096426]|uniref:helix-turn-helix domain-containing protein n=1 Tax=Psychrobacillus sp. NPDC096426 TaxID=3364491 RepID=UPI00382929F8
MNLGVLLKELRGDESLRDAAKRMNISFVYLGMLEKGEDRRTGKRMNPTPETLQQIAKGYKYDYMKLIKVAGYLADEKFNPELSEPFPDNPSLQQWYKSLPHYNEEDVEKLKTMWNLIQSSNN